jgi:hypothetical protein
MCDNYRVVTLLCTVYKILANIIYIYIYILLVAYAEEITEECQGDFRMGRSTVDQIFTETNFGKILGTEYSRCTSSIYWFSSSVWHCMEKGNRE